MNKEIITFSDTEIKERKFHRYKYRFFSEDVYIDNIMVSAKVSSREKNY